MRILMLAQNYAPIVGGEERMVEDLSVELVRRGHEVSDGASHERIAGGGSEGELLERGGHLAVTARCRGEERPPRYRP